MKLNLKTRMLALLLASFITTAMAPVSGHEREAARTQRDRGTVRWFNLEKGFGFIVRDKLRQDVFVHYTSLPLDGSRSLEVGERVEYEIILGPKGLQADKVVRLSQE